jgi:hypothetical protein
MALLPANATFDLYRGVQDDGYGDTEDDDNAPLYTGLRGTLSYRARTVMDPATRTPQQVESYFCLLPQGTDVRNGDRLRNAESGEWFNVSGATPLPTFGFSKDLNVTVTKAGG